MSTTHEFKEDTAAGDASDALIVAFVQGAQWWEYHKTGATMWASDRDQAEVEAETRAANGTLGKSPNDQALRPRTGIMAMFKVPPTPETQLYADTVGVAAEARCSKRSND